MVTATLQVNNNTVCTRVSSRLWTSTENSPNYRGNLWLGNAYREYFLKEVSLPTEQPFINRLFTLRFFLTEGDL